MGWTLREWDLLEEDEQIEWLARDEYRRDYIEQVMEQLKKKPDYSFSAAYVQLLMEQL